MKRTFLNNYVASGGFELPDDYESFVSNGDIRGMFHNDCVFCGELHDNIVAYKYDIGGNGKMDYGLHCCKTCNNVIENTPENKLYNKVDYSSKKFSMRRHEQRLGSVRLLEFDKNTFKYYRHLNPNVDKYVTHNECNRCYICDDIITIRSQSIPIPVSGLAVLNGGRVHICPACENDVDFDFLYKHKESSGALIKKLCPGCNIGYYIDESEVEYREDKEVLQDLDKDWICPECSYKFVQNELKSKHWLSDEESSPPRNSPIQRFKGFTCASCYSPFYIDLTLHRITIHAIHFIHEAEIICQHCFKLGVRDLLIDDTSYRFGRHFVIMVFESDESGIWTFHCYRLPKTKNDSITHVITSHIEAEGGVEAVSIAFSEIQLLLYGNQAEIWN